MGTVTELSIPNHPILLHYAITGLLKQDLLKTFLFIILSIVELERKKERDAAVKIHSWFRKIQVQRYIRYDRI